MITSPAEYAKVLWKIKSQTPPTTALLVPSDERLIEVDLKTRTISPPEFLSVETDHRAETVFFVMDRYHDNIDLSTMNCVIEFVNADRKSGLYVAPFIDNTTFYHKDGGKIIIPWLIEGLATAKAGMITYSLKFFSVKEDDYSRFSYVLNTQPAQSRILEGNNFDGVAIQEDVENMLGTTLDELGVERIEFSNLSNNVQNAYEYLIAQMNRIQGQLVIDWDDSLM